MMDLVLLDIGSLQFTYSQLAASVLYHFSNEQSTYKASGKLAIQPPTYKILYYACRRQINLSNQFCSLV